MPPPEIEPRPPAPDAGTLTNRLETHVHKSTYGPLIYTARYIMVLMRASTYLGVFEGLGPEFSTFLGQNGTRFARSHLMPQKSLEFRPQPFKWTSQCTCPHQNHYVRGRINHRSINSYYSSVDL